MLNTDQTWVYSEIRLGNRQNACVAMEVLVVDALRHLLNFLSLTCTQDNRMMIFTHFIPHGLFR